MRGKTEEILEVCGRGCQQREYLWSSSHRICFWFVNLSARCLIDYDGKLFVVNVYWFDCYLIYVPYIMLGFGFYYGRKKEAYFHYGFNFFVLF